MIKVSLADPHGHTADIDENGRIPVKLPGQQSVVPESANSQTHSFETFTVGNKGQSNIFYYRPVFQNENTGSASNIVATLDSSSTSYVVQLFRASSTNVNTVAVATNSVPVGVLEDNFSTGWTSSSPSKITVTNGATDYYNNTTLDVSSSSLKLTLGNNITGVTVSKTVSKNWSANSTFSFWFRATTLLSMYIRFSDGVNSSTWNFVNTITNTFQQKILNINDPDVISGALNIAAITNITFGTYTGGNLTGQFAWLDALESQVAPTPLYLQLWSFDTNLLPNNLSLGSLLTLDDGNTELEVPITLVRTAQRVNLKYGVTNIANKLKQGAYYGLVFWNKGIGKHNIYGSTSEKIYNNGNTFTAPNSGGILTDIGAAASIYFCVFAYKECYIRTIYNLIDADPLNAKVITISYSATEKKRTATLQNNMRFFGQKETQLDFKDIPRFINGDDQIIINYVDDGNSAVSEFQFGIDAVYEDFRTWG